MEDRASDGSTERVADVQAIANVEEIVRPEVRIERFIAIVVIERSVKMIRSGLDVRTERAAGCSAILRVIRIRSGLDLLRRVLFRHEIPLPLVAYRCSVDEECIRVCGNAGDGVRVAAIAGSDIERVGGQNSNSRSERNIVEDEPAGGRHVLNLLLIDNTTDRCGHRVQQHAFSVDDDLLAYRAGAQAHIESALLR